MLFINSILIAALSQAAPAAETVGYLGGIVVRESDGRPVPGAEVILSIRQQNEFIPAAKTVADENGKFLFEELPVVSHVLYKLGANWEGIHYPGPVTRLTPARSTVGVKLKVHEAVSEPNLLVARSHEVTIRPQPGMMEVSEALAIDNPTRDCYVGKAHEEGGEPETLCLHIPSGFEQVTFDEEFYGRQFSLSGGRLVTGVPWTPGVKELRFTYVLRNEQRTIVWTRPLDLPCGDVTVRILTDTPEDVSCSLPVQRSEQPGEVLFHFTGSELEAGHEIRVELGRLAVSPLAYGKWVASAVLVLLVIGAAVWKRRRRGSAVPGSDGTTSPSRATAEGAGARRSRTRGRKPGSISTPN